MDVLHLIDASDDVDHMCNFDKPAKIADHHHDRCHHGAAMIY